jgi:HAD superfamily hydrolase (TIGR01549 family)
MKYIIFDIDGTLANTKKVDDKCFIEAFQQTFAINIQHQKWENLKHVTDWGITEEIIQREKGRVPHEAEYAAFTANLVKRLQQEKERDNKQFSEVKGAKDFFQDLLAFENYAVGIATGAFEQSAKIKLDAIGIDPTLVSFSNSDHHKSREAITQDVIQQLHRRTQKEPEQIIYFGDGEWDFKTCLNLGIRFIGIDVDGDGKLERLGAKWVFRDYRERDMILRGIEFLYLNDI